MELDEFVTNNDRHDELIRNLNNEQEAHTGHP